MKNKILILAVAIAAAFAFSACSTPQILASATYIAGEVGAASVVSKTQTLAPAMTALATDLPLVASGKPLPAGDALLFTQVLASLAGSGNSNNIQQAALIDGIVTQVSANYNATAPTPLSGANQAIVADFANGMQAGIKLATAAVQPAK